MSGSTSFLVQRYIENAPNSMNGGWVDLGTAHDLKADEGAKAVEQLADSNHPGRHRAIKTDHYSEHTTKPGPSTVEPYEETTP